MITFAAASDSYQIGWNRRREEALWWNMIVGQVLSRAAQIAILDLSDN